MKKIISVWQRNYDGDRLIRDEIVPGAEWVLEGGGVATVKWDGTACLIEDGALWRRYDAKGGKKTPPAGFRPAQEAPDATTGHWPGWLPCGAEPESKWHRDAMVLEGAPSGLRYGNTPSRGLSLADAPSGTYELLGPKVQGNPHGLKMHVLVKHGAHWLLDAPRSFEAMREWLSGESIEGVVFWRGDEAAKVKRKDFGLPWPARP